MNKIIFLACLFMAINTGLIAQATNDKGDYIVDFAPFSPPEQDLMRELINKPAMNFLSTDLEGKTHMIKDYQGDNILIVFWSVDHPNTDRLFEYLDLVSASKSVKILSYCYEDKASAVSFLDGRSYDYPIMTQGKFIGEMSYGHGLGVPRIFFVDRYGIIKDALPESAFNNNPNLYPILGDIIDKAF